MFDGKTMIWDDKTVLINSEGKIVGIQDLSSLAATSVFARVALVKYAEGYLVKRIVIASNSSGLGSLEAGIESITVDGPNATLLMNGQTLLINNQTAIVNSAGGQLELQKLYDLVQFAQSVGISIRGKAKFTLSGNELVITQLELINELETSMQTVGEVDSIVVSSDIHVGTITLNDGMIIKVDANTDIWNVDQTGMSLQDLQQYMIAHSADFDLASDMNIVYLDGEWKARSLAIASGLISKRTFSGTMDDISIEAGVLGTLSTTGFVQLHDLKAYFTANSLLLDSTGAVMTAGQFLGLFNSRGTNEIVVSGEFTKM